MNYDSANNNIGSHQMKDGSKSPDFFVHWESSSDHSSESVYCDRLPETITNGVNRRLRNAVATLKTDTTHIEVSELVWKEPTTLAMTPHRFGFTLLITASNSIEYGYAGKYTHSAGTGNVLFMFPGREITAHMKPGKMRTVTCSFEQGYAEGIVGSLAGVSPAKIRSALDLSRSLISVIMMRLMHEALYPSAGSSNIVESFGHSLLIECAHWLSMGEDGLQAEGRLTSREFGIIERYLERQVGVSPTVADLASACGFSERYFAKLFREQTGCSVAQYIKLTQIAKAKTYLLETDISLKEITFRMGFSTPANFSSAFKAATGSTPGQYRKKNST